MFLAQPVEFVRVSSSMPGSDNNDSTGHRIYTVIHRRYFLPLAMNSDENSSAAVVEGLLLLLSLLLLLIWLIQKS